MNGIRCGDRADRGRRPGPGYGGFSYTKETHTGKIGPIELSVKEKQTVNIRGAAWERS